MSAMTLFRFNDLYFSQPGYQQDMAIVNFYCAQKVINEDRPTTVRTMVISSCPEEKYWNRVKQ